MEHLLGAGMGGLPDWPLTLCLRSTDSLRLQRPPPLLQEQGTELPSVCGEGL